MDDEQLGHLWKIPIESFKQRVEAKPQVHCSPSEIVQMLQDLYAAVENKVYVPQTPTPDNPALSDDYIFDTEDENLILKDLKEVNFVGKIKDLGKGATKRKEQGLPQEYLYVFQYPCRLLRRDAQESGMVSEDILIYIKINNRKTPYEKLFIISFHKNKEKF